MADNLVTQNEKPLLVMLGGPTGIGREQIAQEASRVYGWTTHFDNAASQNPWLTQVESDIKVGIRPSPSALASQLFFLNHTTQKYLQIVNGPRAGVVLLDHALPFDIGVYTANLADLGYLGEAERKLFDVIYKFYSRALPPPTLLVHLYTSSADILRDRILRARPYQNVDTLGLKRLDSFYASTIRELEHIDRVYVNTDGIKLDDPSTFHEVLSIIQIAVQSRLR